MGVNPSLSSQRLGALLHGHVPDDLPPGFGLAGEVTSRVGFEGVEWTDSRCRSVLVNLLTGATSPEEGPSVGRWNVVTDVANQCGNAVMGMGRCLTYQAAAPDGVVVIRMIGLDRDEGDAIATATPLDSPVSLSGSP